MVIYHVSKSSYSLVFVLYEWESVVKCDQKQILPEVLIQNPMLCSNFRYVMAF